MSSLMFYCLKSPHFRDIWEMGYGRTNGRTDKTSCRDAWTHLKTGIFSSMRTRSLAKWTYILGLDVTLFMRSMRPSWVSAPKTKKKGSVHFPWSALVNPGISKLDAFHRKDVTSSAQTKRDIDKWAVDRIYSGHLDELKPDMRSGIILPTPWCDLLLTANPTAMRIATMNATLTTTMAKERKRTRRRRQGLTKALTSSAWRSPLASSTATVDFLISW